MLALVLIYSKHIDMNPTRKVLHRITHSNGLEIHILYVVSQVNGRGRLNITCDFGPHGHLPSQNSIHLYRSCYSGPLKCGMWALNYLLCQPGILRYMYIICVLASSPGPGRRAWYTLTAYENIICIILFSINCLHTIAYCWKSLTSCSNRL